MFKNILVLIVALGFSASAFASKEIQFTANSPVGGTAGGLSMWDNGTTDGTDWGLSVEAYMGMSDVLQVGGVIALGEAEGEDMMMSLGVMARYNLDSELRNSIFFTGGLMYTDMGDFDSIGVVVGAGKRFALSDTITWTPNVTLLLNVAGDIDEGHVLNLNILSFSGFLD